MPPPPEPELLLEHRAFMVAVARELLGDEHRAEDVAQEGLIAAWQSPPRGQNVRGWFRAVARNLARLARRGDSRRERREKAAARPEAQPPSDRVARLESQRRVVDAVLALPEPYRSTVIARYLEARSVAQIAAADGVSPNTVKTRLRRALARLRERLDADHDGDTRAWSSLLLPLLPPVAVPPPSPAAVAAAESASRAAGAMLMSTKTKLVAGAALAVALLILLGLQFRQKTAPFHTRSAAPERVGRPADDSPDDIAVRPSADGLPAPIDFAAIDRERDLHGVVADRAGAPVPGATLEAIHNPWNRTDILATFPGRTGATTTSARDGTFRLSLQAGEVVNLRVQAAGFATVELRGLQAGERARVELDVPAPIVVTVLAHDRTPIADARVELLRYGDGVKVRRVARTNEDGLVRFADLPAGLEVIASATHPAHGAHLDDPRVEAGSDVEIVLPKGVAFRGRVLDAITRAPVAGARVGMNWYLEPATVTDAGGRFVLNGFMGGNVHHELHVLCDGYARAESGVDPAKELLIELAKAARITGRVVDEDRRPIAGARLAAIAESFGIAGRMSTGFATSGADGRFEIKGLAADLGHTLSVTADGYGRASLYAGGRVPEIRRRVLAPEAPADPKAGSMPGDLDAGDIVLRPGRSVSGTLLDAAGEPVSRYKVQLRGPRAARNGTPAPGLYDRSNREERWTDDLGRFRFPDVPAGVFELTVERKGGAGIGKSVVVEDGDVSGIELRFDETRPFRVVVVSDQGAPVSHVALRVRHETGRVSATTDESGIAEFKVKGVVSEVSIWHIFGPGAEPPPPLGKVDPVTDIAPGATEVRLVLPTWASVSGRVLLDGKGLAGANVLAKWARGTQATASNGAGRFHLLVPPDATVTLEVTGKDYPTGFGGFMVDPSYKSLPVKAHGGDRDVKLKVTRVKEDRELRVRVLDPAGEPVAGARVGYWPKTPGKAAQNVATDDRGRARLKKLPARSISIYALLPDSAGYLWPRQRKLVPNGQTITMHCREQRIQRAVVVQENGAPAPKARIELSIDGEQWAWNCDDAGRAEFPIPAGAKRIDFKASWDAAPDGIRRVGELEGYETSGAPPEIRLDRKE